MSARKFLIILFGSGVLSFAIELGGADSIVQPSQETNAVVVASPEAMKAAAEAAVAHGIESLRQANDTAARQNSELLVARLAQIEQSLVAQHEKETRMLQDSNRTTLMVVVGLVVVGLLGMSWAGFLMFRSVNRLVEIAYAPASRQLQAPQGNSLLTRAQEIALPSEVTVEPATGRVLEVLDQLQKRIEDMESVARAPLPPPRSQTEISVQASSGTTTTDSAHAAAPELRKPVESEEIQHLIAKGAALLSQDRFADALVCFDQAVELDPMSADAHLKRGSALEKLNRIEESVAEYDRAIAVEPSLTTAYLCKGSALNQLARYEDAVRCYEDALRTGKNATCATQ